ncbi:MAG TPA: YceI family protein [Candidatus Acidoferrum sp.]|nr:YceI family protein [Candidatus Acidoferrum sp.]
MKSFIIFVVGLAKRRILATSSVVMLGVISPLAFAEGNTWSLDSTTSSARFFQGSIADPDSVNAGVALVTGRAKLDENNIGNSTFDLSIYPADERWGHALRADGTLPANYVPDATDHTLMTFHSKRVRRMADGKLEVIGKLTVACVERSVTLTPNDAYAGPVYGDPVIYAETREVRFLFPSFSSKPSSGRLSSVALDQKVSLGLTGRAGVGHEDFPELLNAIQDTNWPSVVQNEQCQMPSTIGDDYSGATCTGTLIAATHHDNCQMPAVLGGEDYSGPICTPPSGNRTTIVLDLKMLRTSSGSVGEMRSGQ